MLYGKPAVVFLRVAVAEMDLTAEFQAEFAHGGGPFGGSLLMIPGGVLPGIRWRLILSGLGVHFRPLQRISLILPLSSLRTVLLPPLDELARELRDKDFRGKVLLDLLLSNGIARNRFVELQFDGQSFLMRTLRVLPSVPQEIRRSASRFYQRNESLLAQSVLTRYERFLVRNRPERVAKTVGLA